MEKESQTNANESVVIRVYAESVKNRSSETNKPHANFSITGTHGSYDRRALLLAHSRQIRNAAAVYQKVPVSVPLQTNQSRPKIISKKGGKWLNQPVRICSCSSSMEMLPSSTIWCRNIQGAAKERKEGNHFKKRWSSGKNPPLFLGKMKNILSCKGN